MRANIKLTIALPFVLSLVLCLCLKPVLASEDVKPSSTTESFEHWVVLCNSDKTNQSVDNVNASMLCEIKTSVSIKEKNGNIRSLLSINVGQLPGKEDLTILFQVPSGVFLRSNVMIHQIENEQINNQALIEASYFRCGVNQCLANAILPKDILDLMMVETNFSVSFIDASLNRIGIPISMKGFKEAIKSLMNK